MKVFKNKYALTYITDLLMNRFKIGKKFIGLNDPCFIVAEISANHGGLKMHLPLYEMQKIGLDL